MKNIHILPTNKPSRLVQGKNLYFYKDGIEKSFIDEDEKFINIYINSDEEIKEGDYGLSKLNEIIKFHSGYDYRYYSKIILTTDEQLIKEGVQAIDNEFLKWFIQHKK